jgi:hypothetical protein
MENSDNKINEIIEINTYIDNIEKKYFEKEIFTDTDHVAHSKFVLQLKKIEKTEKKRISEDRIKKNDKEIFENNEEIKKLNEKKSNLESEIKVNINTLI